MSNRYLILMRHAEAADPKANQDDRFRRLTPDGHRQAFEAAVLLKKHGFVPQQAIVSPAIRAQESYYDMEQVWDTPPVVITEETLYAVSHGLPPFKDEFDLVATFNDILVQADENATCVLVLGHSPAIPNLVHRIGTNLPYDLTVKYPTATATVLEVSGTSWATLRPNQHPCDKVIFGGTRLIDASPRPPQVP